MHDVTELEKLNRGFIYRGHSRPNDLHKSDGHAGAGRYTDVWAQRDGHWKCVAAHVARG